METLCMRLVGNELEDQIEDNTAALLPGFTELPTVAPIGWNSQMVCQASLPKKEGLVSIFRNQTPMCFMHAMPTPMEIFKGFIKLQMVVILGRPLIQVN